MQVTVGSLVKTYLLQGLVQVSRPHMHLEQLKEPGLRWALEQDISGLLMVLEGSANGQ